MTAKEFEDFKKFLTYMQNFKDMDDNFGLTADKEKKENGKQHYKVTGSSIFDQNYLNSEVGFSQISVRDLMGEVMTAKHYEDLPENYKSSYSDLSYGMNEIVNKAYDHVRAYKADKISDLEDMYPVSSDKIDDREQNRKQLTDFQNALKKASRFNDSPSYRSLMKEVDGAIKELDTAGNNEYLKKYNDILDRLTAASDRYLDHKAKDGANHNSDAKIGAVYGFMKMATYRSAKTAEAIITENDKNCKVGFEDEAFKKNIDFAAGKLCKLYPDKAEEIDQILNKGLTSKDAINIPNILAFSPRSCASELNFGTTLDKDTKAQMAGTIIATNVIISEVVYSGGKRSPILDSIFAGEKPAKDNFIGLCKEDGTSHAKDYMLKNMDNTNAFMRNPLKAAGKARQESPMALNNTKLMTRSMTARADQNIQEIKNKQQEIRQIQAKDLEEKARQAEAQKLVKNTEAYKENMRNKSAFEYLAGMANDASRRKELLKLAKECNERAWYPKASAEKKVAVKPGTDMKKKASGKTNSRS